MTIYKATHRFLQFGKACSTEGALHHGPEARGLHVCNDVLAKNLFITTLVNTRYGLIAARLPVFLRTWQKQISNKLLCTTTNAGSKKRHPYEDSQTKKHTTTKCYLNISKLPGPGASVIGTFDLCVQYFTMTRNVRKNLQKMDIIRCAIRFYPLFPDRIEI